MKKGFFVTATDTSVGKTVISAALIRALNMLGYSTGAMKPVETGCAKEGKTLIPSDGSFLKNIADMKEDIKLITPYTYETPLSPMSAGEIEGGHVSPEVILHAYNDLLKRYDLIVVEGIGGLYVPILRNYFVSDLAKRMGLPLILVIRPSLGTINHTLLTIHYARSKGLPLAGIIINYASPPLNDIAEKTHQKALHEVMDVPIIGVFPQIPDLKRETIDAAVINSVNVEMLKGFCG